jgi:hypothetical protein
MRFNLSRSNTIAKVIWILSSVFAVLPVYAQTEAELRGFFEGKMVIARLDMPATQQGIDVFPKRPQPVDFADYARRTKEHGTAIKSGERVIVTRVKQKGKHIEFHLGGGGYGTLGDESEHVSAPNVEKTKREKNLEKEVKVENDAAKKKAMQEELDELKKEREKEENRLRLMAQQAQAQKAETIAQKKMQAGSRFNIRYDFNLTSRELTPEAVMAALAEYLDFPPEYFGEEEIVSAPALSAPPGMHDAAGLRKGLLWEEVAAAMGAPSSLSERMEGTLKVLSCTFLKDAQKIDTEFVEGVLIRYAISSR